MADDTINQTEQTNEQPTPVRTAADLRIEELSKRLDDMESGYKARIKELEEANASLWAQLHPAPAASQPVDPTEAMRASAEKALLDALGLKEDKDNDKPPAGTV